MGQVFINLSVLKPVLTGHAYAIHAKHIIVNLSFHGVYLKQISEIKNSVVNIFKVGPELLLFRS